MPGSETFATIVMFVMLGVSLLTDLRTGKIYNWITVPGAVCGIVLGMMGAGLAGVGDRLLAMAVVLVIMLLLSPLTRFGGGDTKLLMAIGALQGLHFAVWAMLWTGVAGGILAILVALRRRALTQTVRTLAANLFARAAGASMDLAAGSPLGKMHYSLAIAVGVVAASVLGA